MSWTPLLERAYVPYSNSPEACIVESSTGKLYAGVRIENISYPLSISAIQAACTICLSEQQQPAKVYVRDASSRALTFWVKEFDLEVIETDEPPHKLETLLQPVSEPFDARKHMHGVLKKAVTPNSNFQVASLLFTEHGFFEGANIEVSDWSMGLCAERIALVKGVAAGYTKFKKIALHTSRGEISSPCGACRQVISELLPFHPVQMHHADGTYSEYLSVDLLPLSFKSSQLKKLP